MFSFIMWSLLSERLSKSLIERVHWIYKCVYVFLRLGASVNLVLLSKTVDLGDWLENPEWQVHWPGIFTFALEACWLVFIFEMQILNLKNIVYLMYWSVIWIFNWEWSLLMVLGKFFSFTYTHVYIFFLFRGYQKLWVFCLVLFLFFNHFQMLSRNLQVYFSCFNSFLLSPDYQGSEVEAALTWHVMMSTC